MVRCDSGCPGVRLPSCRKRLISSSGTARSFRDLPVLIDPPHFREMKHGVEQHGSMAVGENEAVAIQPGRIGGIVTQEFLPQAIGDRRQSHGRAGMP